MIGDFRNVNRLGVPHQDAHAQAVKVAHQFEDMMVRTFVSAMRETTKIDDDSPGMFGSGPGADTYADWFDERLSDQISRTGHIGVADVLVREMEQQGHRIAEKAAPAQPADPSRKYLRMPRSVLDVEAAPLRDLTPDVLRNRTLAQGGLDVAV